VYGLQNEAVLVEEGDLYFCYAADDMVQQAELAVQRGCHAVVAAQPLPEGIVPESIPLLVLDDLVDAQQRLALAFYGGQGLPLGRAWGAAAAARLAARRWQVAASIVWRGRGRPGVGRAVPAA
jgi:hypothetical protein